MAGSLQPLVSNQKVVNTDGTPTDYFIRWAQNRQIDIGAGITSEQALQIITTYLAEHELQPGSGIQITPSGNISDNPTIAAEVQAILDQITDVRGSILFRGAAGWEALAPGTNGYFLKTNGAGSNPGWAAGGGGGGGGFPPFQPPLAANFTAASGDATLPTFSDNATYGMLMSFINQAGSNIKRIITMPLPDPTVTWRLDAVIDAVWNEGFAFGYGICAYESATGRTVATIWRSNGVGFAVTRATTLGTSGPTDVGTSNTYRYPGNLFFSLKYDATLDNYQGSYGANPAQPRATYSTPRTTAFTTRADRVGFYFWSNVGGGSDPLACRYWNLV